MVGTRSYTLGFLLKKYKGRCDRAGLVVARSLWTGQERCDLKAILIIIIIKLNLFGILYQYRAVNIKSVMSGNNISINNNFSISPLDCYYLAQPGSA